ncbi:MAG: hypothetical protein H6R01_932 [Burkholderiaceae bacterium]|nr:hypothetical protein [Burkholderiaceae bacterium]
MYKLLTNTTAIVRLSDGAFIPTDSANTDYRHYLAWVAEGNAPLPADSPDPAEVWAAYQAQAQAALDATDMVALRCFKAGVAFPDAWGGYVETLRAIVRADSGDPAQSLPAQPDYPAGT